MNKVLGWSFLLFVNLICMNSDEYDVELACALLTMATCHEKELVSTITKILNDQELSRDEEKLLAARDIDLQILRRFSLAAIEKLPSRDKIKVRQQLQIPSSKL